MAAEQGNSAKKTNIARVGELKRRVTIVGG
jgi:hypothetical protein